MLFADVRHCFDYWRRFGLQFTVHNGHYTFLGMLNVWEHNGWAIQAFVNISTRKFLGWMRCHDPWSTSTYSGAYRALFCHRSDLHSSCIANRMKWKFWNRTKDSIWKSERVFKMSLFFRVAGSWNFVLSVISISIISFFNRIIYIVNLEKECPYKNKLFSFAYFFFWKEE